MQWTTLWIVFLLSMVAVRPARAEDPSTAQITWIVTVPENTSASAKLFMAGNAPALGPWQPNAFQLERIGERTFRGSLRLPVGMDLEYKFTRGSWGSVEKTPEGNEIANRKLTVSQDAEIELTVAAWASAPSLRPSTATGDLRWTEFNSTVLEGSRRVTVWLPPQYRSEPNTRFPVLFMLDGQNVFDATRAAFGAEWQADEAALGLARAEPPCPVILVAIDNSSRRMEEYTPVTQLLNDRQAGGDADTYLRFVCEELKPWIDTKFRTLSDPEHTGIVGSSLGGLFVLHAVRMRPDIFGKGIAMSPSLFWGGGATVEAFAILPETAELSKRKIRLWIDMGTREGRTEDGRKEGIGLLQQLEQHLLKHHSDGIEARVMIEDAGEHNEQAWARRMPMALSFLFSELGQ